MEKRTDMHKEIEISELKASNDEMETTDGIAGSATKLSENQWFRYVLLVLICLMGVGHHFCVDNPAAIQGHVLHDLDLSETDYMGLFSATQWGGIVSCLVGGYLIDRVFGVRWGGVIFTFMLTLAQGLFAGSAMLHNYWVLYCCRILFGLTAGPLSLSSTSMLIKWFKSRNLNMLMGLRTSFAKVGNVVNMNSMEPIYVYFRSLGVDRICLGLAFFVGAGVCFLSFLSACIVGYIDHQWDTREKERDSQTHKQPAQREKVHITDIRNFPATFWLHSLATTFYYLAIFPFVGLGVVYFQMKYKVSPQIAGNLNGLMYLLSAFLLPVFGLVVDKVGRNLLWLLASIVLSIASHALFAFTFVNPYIATTLLGLGYSLFTAITWPMVAHMVDTRLVATAYGIMNAVIMLVLAGGIYVSGFIVETLGYFILELYFIVCQSVALILTMVEFMIVNTKDGGKTTVVTTSDNRELDALS